MSHLRFARTPLLIALILGVLGVVLMFANMGLSSVIAGAAAIVMLVMSVLVANRTPDSTDDGFTDITEADYEDTPLDETLTALMTKPKLSSDQKRQARAAARAAKKETADRAKFERRAEREAKKAEKHARKTKHDVDDHDDWTDALRDNATTQPGMQPVNGSPFGTGMSAEAIYQELAPDTTSEDEYETSPFGQTTVVDAAANGLPSDPLFDAEPITEPVTIPAALDGTDDDTVDSSDDGVIGVIEDVTLDPTFVPPFTDGMPAPIYDTEDDMIENVYTAESVYIADPENETVEVLIPVPVSTVEITVEPLADMSTNVDTTDTTLTRLRAVLDANDLHDSLQALTAHERVQLALIVLDVAANDIKRLSNAHRAAAWMKYAEDINNTEDTNTPGPQQPDVTLSGGQIGTFTDPYLTATETEPNPEYAVEPEVEGEVDTEVNHDGDNDADTDGNSNSGDGTGNPEPPENSDDANAATPHTD